MLNEFKVLVCSFCAYFISINCSYGMLNSFSWSSAFFASSSTSSSSLSFRSPVSPMNIEDSIDQIISIEAASLALFKDMNKRISEDYKSLQLCVTAHNLNKWNKDKKEIVDTLSIRYGIKKFEDLEAYLRYNAENYSQKFVTLREMNLKKMTYLLTPGPTWNPLAVFKKVLFDRLRFEMVLVMQHEQYLHSKGQKGLPSTHPDDFNSLKPSEKENVQLTTDGMAMLDQQLALLYDLLPGESIDESLRQYLSLPSVYVFLHGYVEGNGSEETMIGGKLFRKIIQQSEDDSKSSFRNRVRPLSPTEAIHLDTKALLEKILVSDGFKLLEEEFKQLEPPLSASPSKTQEKKVFKKKKGSKKSKGKFSAATSSNEMHQKSEEDSDQEELENLAHEVSSLTVQDEETQEAEHEKLEMHDENDRAFTEVDLSASTASSSAASSSSSLRKKYQPERSTVSKKEARIAQMKEEIGASKIEAGRKVEEFVPLIQPTALSKENLATYEALFKLGNQSVPIKWVEFKNMFEALGGEILNGSGNGSSRTLILKGKKENGDSYESTRCIHEPHSKYGSTFGYESLNLIREYFQFWNLAPQD